MHGRPHRCSTNFQAAAVTLASGQRTNIVSSYQNDASPQPRTTASHCGLDNVSNEKKYEKSHCALCESQDIVHTVAFRGAMVVYNRTITEKITTISRARGHPLRLMGEKRSRPSNRLEDAPNSHEQSYRILRKKIHSNEVQQFTISREVAQQIKYPYVLRETLSGRRSRAMPSPGAVKGAPSVTIQTLYRLLQMCEGKYATKTTNRLYKTVFTSKITLEAN